MLKTTKNVKVIKNKEINLTFINNGGSSSDNVQFNNNLWAKHVRIVLRTRVIFTTRLL